MRLLDANVLVYAHREDAPQHAEYHGWLRGVLAGDEPFAVTSLVWTAFVRIVTHRRVFDPPSPVDSALAFAEDIRSHDHCVTLEPASRHWDLFKQHCRNADARGNLVTDAHLAALAVETGSENRHYGPGLREVRRCAGGPSIGLIRPATAMPHQARRRFTSSVCLVKRRHACRT